jgi:predicted SAM-dependent methyltransferase
MTEQKILNDKIIAGKGLYFGHLFESEKQYKSGEFIGLALYPRHDREIKHNLYNPLPVKDESISKIQSQDVCEHLEYNKMPALLNEVYRALRVGGIFRLSIPDYRSPVLTARSAFDKEGNVIADLMMGNTLRISEDKKTIKRIDTNDGNAHLWFPTYENLLELILMSDIRKCNVIKFHHYFKSGGSFVCESFDDLGMPVDRCPPKDMRAGGQPISIIVDFIK